MRVTYLVQVNCLSSKNMKLLTIRKKDIPCLVHSQIVDDKGIFLIIYIGPKMCKRECHERNEKHFASTITHISFINIIFDF